MAEEKEGQGGELPAASPSGFRTTVSRRSVSGEFGFTAQTSDGDEALRLISEDFSKLSQNVAKTVAFLINEQRWREALRASVKYGGLQQADIARELGVMRSTVTRWFAGETEPPKDLMKKYGIELTRAILLSNEVVRERD